MDLVIFDCDGVLVDSEPLSLRVLVENLAEAGLDMHPDTAQSRFLGISLASICDILSAEFGVDLTRSHLRNMRLRLYELFRHELRSTNGIGDTLDRLVVPRCVASSSQPERIRLALKVTGLLPKLTPHIFSATMVARGKPAPDLFLYAAAQMDAAIERCVVVEDSPAGVEAARRAGMRVFAFAGATHARTELHRQRLLDARPDRLFDDMRALPDVLEEIGQTA